VSYPIETGAFMLATVRAKLFQQTILLTQAYRYTGPGLANGGGYLQFAATAMVQPLGIIQRYAECVPDAISDTELSLQWIEPSRYIRRVFTWGGHIASGGSTVTTNTAAAIAVGGDNATRKGHGVKHIVCPTESMDLGTLSPAHRIKVELLAAELKRPLDVSGGTLTPILIGPGTAQIPSRFVVISEATVSPTVRVMRRRTVGVGE
jgi:hypothetical protein